MSALRSICKVLNLTDPTEDAQCLGTTQMGARCRNIAAAHDRSTAAKALANINEALQQGRDVSKQLQEVSYLLLCKRWHAHSQSKSLADQWQRKLDENKVESQQATTPVAPISPSTPQGSARNITDRPSSKNAGNEEAIALLSTRVAASKAYGDLTDMLLKEQAEKTVRPRRTRTRASGTWPVTSESTWTSSSSGFRSSSWFTPAPTPRTEGLYPLQTPSTQGTVRPSKITISIAPWASPSFSLALAPLPRSTSLSLAELRAARVAALSPVSELKRQPEPLRQSHLECLICTDTYDEDPRYWECQRCQNRTHQKCFDAWCASTNRITRCPCCRVDVV